MNTKLLMLTALIMAAALRAQYPTSPKPASSRPMAPQQFVHDPADYASAMTFIRLGLTGKTICGHVVDEGTFVDTISDNSAGQKALAMRWLDWRPGTIVHSAIVTGQDTCFIADGALVEGKTITLVMPNSLAINNEGIVAWEGKYRNSFIESTSDTPHRGAFVGNRFLFEIDERNATPETNPDLSKTDFIWSKEVLVPRPGVVLTVMPVNGGPAQPIAPTSPLQKAAPAAPQTPAPNARGQRPQPGPKPVPKVAPKPAVAPRPKVQKRPLPCLPFRPCPAAKQ